ncbi:MAG TPA: hypothetical protein VI112_03395 [Bacteroidia bacterium]|jgi:hypothetical protein
MLRLKGAGIHDLGDLRHRIIHLGLQKEEEEENIKRMLVSICAVRRLKQEIEERGPKAEEKKEAKRSVGREGLRLGAGYLAGKIFGSNTLKGFISTVAVERILEGLMKEYEGLVMSGIERFGKVFRQSAEKE